MDGLVWFIMFLINLAAFLMIYFIPTLVARQRKHPNIEAIGILNLFLGWTLLGWVVALIWAVTKQERR